MALQYRRIFFREPKNGFTFTFNLKKFVEVLKIQLFKFIDFFFFSYSVLAVMIHAKLLSTIFSNFLLLYVILC